MFTLLRYVWYFKTVLINDWKFWCKMNLKLLQLLYFDYVAAPTAATFRCLASLDTYYLKITCCHSSVKASLDILARWYLHHHPPQKNARTLLLVVINWNFPYLHVIFHLRSRTSSWMSGRTYQVSYGPDSHRYVWATRLNYQAHFRLAYFYRKLSMLIH